MSNELQCNFKFHTVGQGLFYTGQLKAENNTFDFVYDCGSDNKTPRMKAVSNYKKSIDKDKKIDLLVISHLHTDHYNGIKQLLKNRGAKIAILPYAPLWERMVIKCTSKKNTWNSSFIENPAAFLINECDIDEVIFVDNSNLDDEENFFLPDEITPNPELNDLRKMKIKPIGNGQKPMKGRIQNAESGGSIITMGGRWFFTFYNNPLAKEIRWQFTQILKNIGIDLNDSESIIELLQCAKNNKIAAAYKQVFGIGDELNITSLITMHGPCGNPNLLCKGINDKTNHSLCIKGPYYQMLTGDFSFPLWLDDFYNKNQRLLRKVSIASIPHHGSIYNWNDKVMEKINVPLVWIATHSTKNYHGHPSASVKKSVKKYGKHFVSVTEKKGVEIGGKFIWNSMQNF